MDVFDVKNTRNILSREIVENSGVTPYLCASAENNGVSSYISHDENLLDKGNCVFIGGKTFVVSYQEKDFYSNDSHNLVLYLKDASKRNQTIQLFLASCVNKSLGHIYSWGDSISFRKIQKDYVTLPIKNGKIDFDFIKNFTAQLEVDRVNKLESFLKEVGLIDFQLTDNERDALENYKKLKWHTFNLVVSSF